MGIFRTFLALSVVFAHLSLGGRLLIGGQSAVQIFYMVSGFLITYVLLNSYSNIKLFYLNRFLRIYPVYWVVAIFIAIFFLYINHDYYRIYSDIPFSADLLLVLSNIFLFGQDLVMFLGVENNALKAVAHFSDSTPPLWQGLLISPAWTLGLELTFYIVAPFIVKNKMKIILVLFASIALRVYLVSLGLRSDPWSYRFFPTELALFMLGALACHYKDFFWNKSNSKYALATALFLMIVYPFIPLQHYYKVILMVLLSGALLPGLFLFEDKYGLDKKIGELSFPIYICHIPVFIVCAHIFNISNPILLVLATIVVSFILAKYVAQRVEAVRRRVRLGA